MKRIETLHDAGAEEAELKKAFRDGCLKLGHLERVQNLYRIQSKLGRSAAWFQPNKSQLKYLRSKKGRDIILKIRQVGFTTLSCVRGLDLALWESNTRTGIMAHTEKVVATIFKDLVKFTFDWFVKDWAHLYAPTQSADSATELAFKDDGLGRPLDSSMRVLFDFRGKTVHFLHVSEASRIEPERLVGSLQGVPANGEVIFESTPNGRGGEFYRQWQNWRLKGDNAPYKGHFVPWFEHYPEEPTMWSTDVGVTPLTSWGKDEPDWSKFPGDMTEYERSLTISHRLEPFHIKWRRWCIDTNCEGNAERFDNEYPADDESCFFAGENQVFSQSALRWHDRRTKAPTETGFLVASGASSQRFVDDTRGWVSVWAKPKPSGFYVIGADSASGVGADDSAAIVLDCRSGETVARLWGQIPPAEFAEHLVLLGKWYNNAWICPEVNNHGHAVIQAMLSHGYRNIYKRKQLDVVRDAPATQFGFLTTGQSKLPLTERLRQDVHSQERLIIYDRALVDQLSTFVQINGQGATRSVRREAAAGAKDDLVIAAALACEMRAARAIIDEDLERDPTFDNSFDELNDESPGTTPDFDW